MDMEIYRGDVFAFRRSVTYKELYMRHVGLI